jgi:2,3-bisphosphoglycerate-independent phosphoglycerate mutase
MSHALKNLPVVLVILDGWGVAPASRGNAISETKLRFYDSLVQNYTSFSLAASGEAVGLPWGEPGNSEVGHQNLGAGRIIYQDVLRINNAIEDNSFFELPALVGAIKHCKQHNSSLHIVGMLSEGGVHSHQDHVYANLELAARNGLKRVYLHLILDGRDVPFNSAPGYIKKLEKIIKRLKVGSIATMSGRFYAMDRDNHWERIERAYKAIVKADALTYPDALSALAVSYKSKIYDEEFVPVIINPNKEANAAARIQSGDSIIMTNYRPDRARQLAKVFSLPTFTKFNRATLSNVYVATMTQYDPNLPVHVVFKKEAIERPIAQVWSEAGLTQLHIAETEKYAHVTYFFNGGKDINYKGQENVIIPSLGIASYADKPEMSTPQITKHVLGALQKNQYDVYVINFANADMVGHSGNLRATALGLSTIDASLKQITKQVLKRKGVLIITADHGNAEEMVNWENGHIIKEHSTNPVPAIVVGEEFKLSTPKPKGFTLDTLKVKGVLSDVAPTMLTLNSLSVPHEMSSRPLI